MPHKQEFEHVIAQKNSRLDSKLKRNREKLKSNGLKRDRPKERETGSDLETEDTTHPFYELGLLNKQLISNRREADTLELETAYYNELMLYIKMLEDENTQLKSEIEILDTTSLPSTAPNLKKKGQQPDAMNSLLAAEAYRQDYSKSHMLDPYTYKEFENFFS